MSQVTGDYLDSCTGFIGPSSESVFLRDCKDCILTIACKQLRLRDCHNCIFFLYSHTDPALEGSTNCQFAPFNGAYAGLRDLFAKAKLDPEDNHWREIFDFHKDMTVTKEGKAIPEPHWLKLPEEDFYENRLELPGVEGVIENPVPLDAVSKHLGEEDEGGMLGFDIKTTTAKDALEVYDNIPEESAATATTTAPTKQVPMASAPKPVATSAAAAPRAVATEELRVGTRVRAKLPAWESMYPGVITAVQANNKYAIRFDDGDEQTIKGYLIEPEVKPVATSEPVAATTTMVDQVSSGGLSGGVELPDRASFESERAYLKHIYKLGWFEFKDRSNEKVSRLPGLLYQQMFELERLTNCEIELLDDMSQVTGDYLDSCTGFIGPSSESVFLRDCKDCILTIACKQLRLRDCHNCIFFLYSHTDPALEGSTNCQFAPFN